MIKNIPRTYLWILVSFLIFVVGDVLFAAHYTVLPENTYNLLPGLANPVSTDRILLVSPHPDDETLGAAGYVQEALKDHATIRVVLATDGNKHGLKDTRHQEMINSLKVLGLPAESITFLDFPDGNLSNEAAFVPRLREIITDFHPTVVIGTHPSDTHPDHAAVGRAIDVIGKEQKDYSGYYFLIHYHRYPRPTGLKTDKYEVPAGRLVDGTTQWESYLLSQDQVVHKQQAVEEYKSQLSLKNPVLRELLFSFIRQNEIFAVKSYR